MNLPLPDTLPNLGTVMKAAGYNVVYKGKWHCSKPAGRRTRSAALRPRTLRLRPLGSAGRGRQPEHPEAGGGYTNNDGRIIESKTRQLQGSQRGRAAVPRHGGRANRNPSSSSSHWSTRTTSSSTRARRSTNRATTTSWLAGDIEVPPTNEEDLSTKPSVQEQFLRKSSTSPASPKKRSRKAQPT